MAISSIGPLEDRRVLSLSGKASCFFTSPPCLSIRRRNAAPSSVEAITSHFWLLLKGHEETAIIVRKGARDGRKLQIPNHSGVLQLQPVPDVM